MRGVAPPRNPGTSPPNHHAPCCQAACLPALLHCPCQQACPLQVRASSLCRAHLLEALELPAVSVLYSALPCHCHCRVWEFGNGRNVAMPSADFLGREKQGEETRQLVRTNRLRRVGCLLLTVSRTSPGLSGILLLYCTWQVDDDSVHVLPDLPRLVVALCFSRPARALARNAVLAGRSFLDSLAYWLGSRGPSRRPER